MFERLVDEPLLFDDDSRMPVDDLIRFLAYNAETLICRKGKDVVGVAVFLNVVPTRSAEFIGWVAPEYRYAQQPEAQRIIDLFIQEDILEYAWQELQLVRLEGRVAAINKPALGFAAKMRFREVGTLTKDFRFRGELFDRVLFELVNPAFDESVEPLKEKVHGIRSQLQTSGQSTGRIHSDDDVEHDVAFEPYHGPPLGDEADDEAPW